ncbi:MAG: hypothetical protein DCF32_21895 [Leptolyngbya sp.]|nr:MAG: hypothetical protein DCF32_21895 [Leptolyngbya sp.]
MVNSPLGSSPTIDWGEAPDVSVFFGREAEIATLSQWVVDDGYRLVAVLGMGGMGNTALTAKLVETLVDLPQPPFERIILNPDSIHPK